MARYKRVQGIIKKEDTKLSEIYKYIQKSVAFQIRATAKTFIQQKETPGNGILFGTRKRSYQAMKRHDGTLNAYY